MKFLRKFYSWKNKLENSGFRVFTPTLIDLRTIHLNQQDFLTAKRAENLKHFRKIKRADVVLVLNYGTNKSKSYIGGSTFAEIALAFYWKKPIFLVNPIPRRGAFSEELKAWQVRQWRNFKSSNVTR